jgi:hypothetical protein
MRPELLDIKVTPNGRTPQPATVIRMHIQPRNSHCRRQRHRQLQLCVPLVTLKGDSYRLKNRDLGRIPATTAGEE